MMAVTEHTGHERERTVTLGTDCDGHVVTVTVRMRVRAGVHETTGHETTTDPLAVSVTHATWAPGHGPALDGARGEPDSLGAGADPFRAVRVPADGWTVAGCATLADMAEAWHLSDMRAGCAHVAPTYETDRYGRRVPSLDDTPRCPVTGYRYGHAWLVEPVTSDALAYWSAILETGRPPNTPVPCDACGCDTRPPRNVWCHACRPAYTD